jgi:signal transduction histidine kinase
LQRALHTRQLRQQVQVQQRALEWYALSLERQVEQRTRELVALNVTKDALLSTVAHELASPLTGLKSMAMMIERQLQRADSVEKIRSTVGNMTRAMSRLERIVQDLQDASLIQTRNFVLQRSHCDLVELGRQILAEFMAGEEMALDYEVLDQPLEVNVDPQRISQALLNLLSNARKYSPEGAPIAVQVRKNGQEAIISVRDRGVGIPAEQLAHVAEQFYRVPGIEVQTGSSSGLGLGLYLTRKIVEQHGGRLEVQSQEGQGSTFSLVLPLVE